MFRCAIIVLALLATDLAAQPPVPIKPQQPPSSPPRYVRFPIDGNPEQMLAEFLKTKDGQGLFQQMLQGQWQQLLDQPPENLEKLLREKGNENPVVRELVEKFLKDHPGLQKGDPAALEDALKKFGGQLEGNKALTDMIMKGLEQKLGPGGLGKIEELVPPVAPGDVPNLDNLPKLDDLIDEDMSLENRFGEWLSDLLKNEDVQRDLADFFRDAPDLQEAMTDLFRSLQGPDANGNWTPKLPDFGGGKWNLDLKPPKLPFELGKLPRMPALKMPPMPKLNLPMPKLGNIGAPRVPGFGPAPNMPNMRGGPSFAGGAEWIYILAAIVIVGLAWWFLRKFDWSARVRRGPVAALLAALPSSITTRTELRKAFDALALTRLGDKARPWNHRHVARQLGKSPDDSKAADAFANLYEMARYTPGDDRLSPAEQAAVRASLAVLAGGAA